MWLPKNERRLLAGYYKNLGGVSARKAYHIVSLPPLLKFRGHTKLIPEYSQSGPPSSYRNTLNCFQKLGCIEAANNLLSKRGLIRITSHVLDNGIVTIELTVEGYDLGRKYASFYESSGLWYQERRNHWLWLILAFLAGAITIGIINVVTENLKFSR